MKNYAQNKAENTAENKPELPPTPPEGLSEKEAERRRQNGDGNICTQEPGKSVGRILAENFFSPFNLLNFALAACLILVGSYRNMMFLGVVFSNTFIGTFQELRARHVLQKLRLLNAPTAHVLRDGKERACSAEELVRGDLVVLHAGDQVLADGTVESGTAAVNESLLTGESDAIGKKTGDMLLSGSYLTEGRVVQLLTRVGDDSYANKLMKEAKKIERPKSELMSDLNKLIRVVSMLLIPLGLLLFLKQVFLRHDTLSQAVPTAVAAMIGMIPEGLMLLTSVALAVGVVKLGRKGTLVQELYGIETLARVDTLCLDKTGTLTKGEMKLEQLLPVSCEKAVLEEDLASFLSAFDDMSPTLQALRKAYPPKKREVKTVLPFSSARKKSAVTFSDNTTLVLGAPSFVLGKAGIDDKLRAQIGTLSEQGLRVMVLAACDGPITGDDTPPVSRVLGLCCLSDVLRDHVEDTLRYFDKQGVTLKVISGDDPKTVADIARRAGLRGYQNAVDATTLDTDEKLQDACEKYTVFGRVTPQQKCKLVKAMKANGHSVAMTGDGVNDIPALKAADCSIAMAGGADAARHAAQLTLLNADFAGMPQIVGEGRRVINNITRAASLFLVKTLYSFFLSVLLLIFPVSYPFQPVQLTLISSLTIGIPTFFLALEPNSERVHGRFLSNVIANALPGAVSVTLCAILAMTLGPVFGLSSAECKTLSALVTGFVGIMVLFRVCLPFNPLHTALLVFAVGGMTSAVIFIGSVFYLSPMTLLMCIMLAVLCALAVGISLLTRRLLPRTLITKKLESLQTTVK